MKKNYSKPSVEVHTFDAMDIVNASVTAAYTGFTLHSVDESYPNVKWGNAIDF